MESNTTTLPRYNAEARFPVDGISLSHTDNALGLGYGAIHAPATSEKEAHARGENMRGYFARVEEGTPSDCIDGRHAIELLNGLLVDRARPGVAGGAALTGFVAGELSEYFSDSQLSIREKFAEIIKRLEDSSGDVKPVVVGGHVDKDAVDSEYEADKTGCGAADKLLANIALLSTINVTYIDQSGVEQTETDEQVDQRIGAVKALTSQVANAAEYYEYKDTDNHIDEIIAVATEITEQAKLEGWSGVIMKDAVADKGENRVVVLDTTAGGVHGHTERKVLFNFIENTTFDQDAYFDDTLASENVGREIFDVDVWHIRDIANKLAESNESAKAEKLFAAGIAFQIGTYLGLCDGSHRAYFAKSK